jgi:hypothetical protein
MTIRLHVERLALEGLTLTGAERVRLERALVGELTRLLEAEGAERVHGAFVDGGAIAGLRGSEVVMAPGESTAALGVQVARSVYGTMMPATDTGGRETFASSSGRARSKS